MAVARQLVKRQSIPEVRFGVTICEMLDKTEQSYTFWCYTAVLMRMRKNKVLKNKIHDNQKHETENFNS